MPRRKSNQLSEHVFSDLLYAFPSVCIHIHFLSGSEIREIEERKIFLAYPCQQFVSIVKILQQNGDLAVVRRPFHKLPKLPVYRIHGDSVWWNLQDAEHKSQFEAHVGVDLRELKSRSMRAEGGGRRAKGDEKERKRGELNSPKCACIGMQAES